MKTTKTMKTIECYKQEFMELLNKGLISANSVKDVESHFLNQLEAMRLNRNSWSKAFLEALSKEIQIKSYKLSAINSIIRESQLD